MEFIFILDGDNRELKASDTIEPEELVLMLNFWASLLLVLVLNGMVLVLDSVSSNSSTSTANAEYEYELSY